MPEVPRFVLLDRDGVINKDLPGSVCRVEDFELLPDAATAIARLNDLGFAVLVITNQACVGRGDLAIDELRAIHARMHEEIAAAGGKIDAVYVCPHTDDDDCDCRKPRPGLIEQAARDYGFDRAATWMVGDSERDVVAAHAAGCRAALARSGKSLPGRARNDVPVFDRLLEFVDALSEGRVDHD